MLYTLHEISSSINAQRFGIDNDVELDWLLTDSRSLAFPETTIFFAIHTERNDGHRYIYDMYRRGVHAFVVEQVPPNYASDYPEACFLLVPSTLQALQRLAENHRKQFKIPVIGITGSNGKTIVKEWLYQLLSPSKNVTRSPRSYNSQIGVPLSVCLLNKKTDIGIFEAGISQIDEITSLEKIIRPTIGVMTNIGQAHQENFSSLEEKCLEKVNLFKDADVLIYNGDDPIITKCVNSINFVGDQIAWSKKDSDRALYIRKIEKGEHSSRIYYTTLNNDHELTIPFVDDASIENAINCLGVCFYLHIPPEEIKKRMEQLLPVAMRLEVKKGVRDCTLINDSYNSDINSLDIALDFMQRRPDEKGMTKTLILSDIQESGMTSQSLYQKVSEMISRRGINYLIGIGSEISEQSHLFHVKKSFFACTEAFLNSGIIDLMSHQVVLLKGARHFNFEKISELLSLKVHETILEVNLAAIADNLNFYRSFMQPKTKLVCMVKANAYGAGSVEIAKTLQDRGVNYLAVAVADEGVDLRKAGITTNIIIMNPEMSCFNTLFEYNLQPEVYNFRLLDALIQAAKSAGITDFPIHIKLDTGMHRLGFHPEEDIPTLIKRLKQQKSIIPRSVFSHFVGSDSPYFDDFSAEQFARFDKASKVLQAAFPHKILRHICNSAGIERFPERHLDMCRLGLGLYGIDPIDNRRIHNVTSLKTTILQIRDVPTGDTVGYSRKGKVIQPSRIAAIPIGYADGLNRYLGNGNAYCLVNGQKAYYVGNICMDVAMIDVTHISCKEGDNVEIFGDHLPVTVLSDILDTIPYELLTLVSNRVKRIYYQE